MSFDLKKNDPTKAAEVGYEFDLTMPDGTITDIKIKVRGSLSKVVKDFYRNAFSQMQVKEQAAKKRGKEPEPMSLQESEDFAIQSSALRVISWSGIVEDSKEVPYSKDECIRLMTDYPFIREAVTAESEQLLNFRT
jgi:cation transport regulator ChaB